MSKKTLLIVLVPLVIIIGIISIITIPYGIKVNDLSDQFTLLESDISNMQSNFNNSQDTKAFCSYVENIKNYFVRLDEVNNSLIDLQKEENFFKKIWKKTDLKSEELVNQRSILVNMITRTDEKTINVLKYTCNEIANLFKNAGSSEKINSITMDLKEQLRDLNTCLFNINTFTSSTEFQNSHNNKLTINTNLLKDQAVMIQNVAKNGITSLQNIISKNQNEFSNKVENTRSVSEINSLSKAELNNLVNSKSSLSSLSEFGNNISNINTCEKMINNSTNYIKSDLKLVENIINAQNRSNDIMKNALSKADNANNDLDRLERFADARQIYDVYSNFSSALSEARRSRNALNISLNSNHQRKIYDNLMNGTIDKVNQIASKLDEHTSFVYGKYNEARTEESNWLSSASRTVKRTGSRLLNWLGQKVEEVSESRAGQEISISVKALILGTRAYFDLLNPNTDPFSWAMAYQGDVTQLMDETDRVMNMEGPSITGKNTFIEGLVNSAYNETYRK